MLFPPWPMPGKSDNIQDVLMDSDSTSKADIKGMCRMESKVNTKEE